ncbi:alpha/beta hydrolase [Alkalicoccobacillus gibsonii]|uniref:Alpha/beta hydrolase n=1 Tax=Alkalicoccobacillus gibsonii TaxID=79881 RepID=A0ABU9VDC4_9BACI
MKRIQFDYEVGERTYKVVGDRHLTLYTFEPPGQFTHPRPAILFFNGGSFKKDPKLPNQFQHQAHYFSTLGMLAICVDYRNGADDGFIPPQAISDVKSAVRYVRRNANELGVDPNNIIVCGSSAGGYITVSSIMFTDLDDEQESDQDIDHVPNHFIVFSADMDGVDIMRRRYPDLVDQATAFSPLHHIKKSLPDTLWICGTGDDLCEQNKRFVEDMNQAGNRIEFKTYEGMEHGFFNYGKHENTYFERTKDDIEAYLRRKSLI